MNRRRFLAAVARGSAAIMAGPAARALAQGGPAQGAPAQSGLAPDPVLAGRPLVRYPEKTDLILLTSRPPQLETPMRYFDRAITPNEAFFVRYHVAPIPTSIDGDTWKLRVHGQVDRPLELGLTDLRTRFPSARLSAVAQCAGNSRGRFSPRVAGGQWGDGAMGNAEWVGARLREILAAAGVRPGAVQVTFDGLDGPAFPSVPDFVKSLDVRRVMEDPDVIVAYEMNGQPLPMLNGFPARLIVPGWYATYWVKHLADIEVVDGVFDGYWMKSVYRIPDTPCGCVAPGAAPGRTVSISRMPVRSFVATPEPGARVPAGRALTARGIAFDGGYGITEVQVSTDDGATWRRAQLGSDRGPYSFREWLTTWVPPAPGSHRLMVRAFNRLGESQGVQPLWNPSGYLRNIIEHVEIQAG